MSTRGLIDRLDGIVHEATQVHDYGIDLTLAEVYDVDFPGRVDFGSGELEAADCTPHERVWRNEEDDYQWWHLESGQYLIKHNESLSGDEPVTVQTRGAVLDRGAFHPTVTVDALDRLPLAVPPAGIRLKENARVSTIQPSEWA